ncbi:MAG TPA: hypothetical protein VFB49_05525 [Patescibacteria group bacterium]|nr:hypothetical protein [Patescibacteria group bacterium]
MSRFMTRAGRLVVLPSVFSIAVAIAGGAVALSDAAESVATSSSQDADPGSGGTTPGTAVPVEKEPMHRIVWEVEQLRVYDIVVPPHKNTLYHTHLHDFMGVTIAVPPKDKAEAEEKAAAPGEEAEPEAEEERPIKEYEVWFESQAKPYTHRITNPSRRPLHMVAIEVVKTIEFLPGQRPFSPAVGSVELENERVRVVRYTLDPGQSVPDHVHNFPVFIVALGPGQVADACRPDMHDHAEAAGFLCFTSGPPDHKIRNSGYRPISLLEFEVRQAW